MKKSRLLLDELLKYNDSGYYPFHMPGHKRNINFPNPFKLDITEIDGFDNLHHPDGILKESMEWAAEIYHADQTYYLVNGSTCGLLSAISAVTTLNGTILISRNCHKAVYHGVILNQLEVEYVYPQYIDDYCVCGGLRSEDIEKMLKTNKNIQAVLIVSPTYDGIVSDIQEIAKIVHSYGIPLIVDEAHGAHFSFGGSFPQSAIKLGADLVIQSVHKTLPSLTQTAVLHAQKGYIDIAKLEKFLAIYQSSSPSYILMASIESCINHMMDQGLEQLKKLEMNLIIFRNKMKQLKMLRIMDEEVIGRWGVFDLDQSKILISTVNTNLTGVQLNDILRTKYHLEMELSSHKYVLGIATVSDTEEGLSRLSEALLAIDMQLTEKLTHKPVNILVQANQQMSLSKAEQQASRRLLWKNCEDKVSQEFIYVYPPGIPFIVPGELISKKVIEMVNYFLEIGLSVQGPEDKTLEFLLTVKEIDG